MRARELHRKLIYIAGSAEWVREEAESLLEGLDAPCLWVGDTQVGAHQTTPQAKVKSRLGTESDVLVMDAYSGFDPDAFAAASGSVRGGGWIIILAPGPDDWPHYPDPAGKRLLVYPKSIEELSGRFIQRFVTQLLGYKQLIHIHQVGEQTQNLDDLKADLKKDFGIPHQDGRIEPTEEQQGVIDALMKVATGHRRRPLVLTADRGRGKSTAMGMAAAALIQGGRKRILVTAPAYAAVEMLFANAQALLPHAKWHKNRLLCDEGTIEFLTVDELLGQTETCDLLLVDEAAAIPLHRLRRLLQKYSRIAFSSTVHGYEGTGRGFALRFSRDLKELTPQWKQLNITTPVRWAENDPVEDWLFDALLMSSEPAAIAAGTSVDADAVKVALVERDELLRDEALLSDIMGLMMLAHYQTRPFDLRNLLDGPELQIWLMKYQDRLVASAWVALEGGFGKELSRDVYQGQRRPHGHLLAQSLTAHAGYEMAAIHSYARIMRIVVHPDLVKQGLGSALINRVAVHYEKEGLDFIGASFAASPELISFWRKNNFLPVRMGVKRDSASGSHSVIMLKALSEGSMPLAQEMCGVFAEHFPRQLADIYRDLEPALVKELLSEDLRFKLSDVDVKRLTDFAQGYLNYDVVSVPLWHLICATLGKCGQADVTDQMLNIAVRYTLQKYGWQPVVAGESLPDKAALMETLRNLTLQLIKLHQASG